MENQGLRRFPEPLFFASKSSFPTKDPKCLFLSPEVNPRSGASDALFDPRCLCRKFCLTAPILVPYSKLDLISYLRVSLFAVLCDRGFGLRGRSFFVLSVFSLWGLSFVTVPVKMPPSTLVRFGPMLKEVLGILRI
jgi:hypothetical protein